MTSRAWKLFGGILALAIATPLLLHARGTGWESLWPSSGEALAADGLINPQLEPAEGVPSANSPTGAVLAAGGVGQQSLVKKSGPSSRPVYVEQRVLPRGRKSGEVAEEETVIRGQNAPAPREAAAPGRATLGKGGLDFRMLSDAPQTAEGRAEAFSRKLAKKAKSAADLLDEVSDDVATKTTGSKAIGPKSPARLFSADPDSITRGSIVQTSATDEDRGANRKTAGKVDELSLDNDPLGDEAVSPPATLSIPGMNDEPAAAPGRLQPIPERGVVPASDEKDASDPFADFPDADAEPAKPSRASAPTELATDPFDNSAAGGAAASGGAASGPAMNAEPAKLPPQEDTFAPFDDEADADLRRGAGGRATNLPAKPASPIGTFEQTPVSSGLVPASNNGPQKFDLVGDGEPGPLVPRGLQQPRLTIEKIAPPRVSIGQPLIYTIVVKNVGTVDANQVVVEDRIPKGTQLTGTAPQVQIAEKRLIWKIGTLRPDESQKLAIRVIPMQEGTIGSVAKLSFAAEVTADIVVTAPQLAMQVRMPKKARVGENIPVTFRVTNSGKGEAIDAIIRDMVPEGLRHAAGTDVEYNMGSLAPGETREISLDLVAVKPGLVVNKTTLAAKGATPVQEELPIEIVGEQLTITRSGPQRSFMGRPTTYTNTVRNDGTAAVVSLDMYEVVPNGFDFVEASDGGRFDPTSRRVSWQVGSIAPQRQKAVTVKLLPKGNGDQRSQVSAVGPSGTPVSIESMVSIEGLPALVVEPLNDQRIVGIGERVTTKIQIKNRGSAVARRVAFSVDLPPGLKLISANGPGRVKEQGNQLIFEPIPELNVQEQMTFDITVEALGAGDSLLGLKVQAEHLNRPMTRDEIIQVVPDDGR